MNKSIIDQAAKEYAIDSFAIPVNSLGEPLPLPPGQRHYAGYREHCEAAEKHFKAGAMWHKCMTLFTVDSVVPEVHVEISPLRRFIRLLKLEFLFIKTK